MKNFLFLFFGINSLFCNFFYILFIFFNASRKDFMRMRKACSFTPKKNNISLWLSTSIDSSLVNPDWNKLNRSNLKLIQNVKETKRKVFFFFKFLQKNLHH